MNEPRPIVVANFKAHKNWFEMESWIDEVASKCAEFKGTIIFCPSSPFLASAHLSLATHHSSLKLGAQDISKFEQGSYTGEISASQVAKICQYAIVGHSERRKYFGETDSDVIQKVGFLIKSQITPILCVSDLKQLDSYKNFGKTIGDNAQKIIFVYEPPSAISADGDYRPQDPGVANENAGKIGKILNKKVVTLYGGSINPQNVQTFFSKENIAGGLVGQACFDAETFLQLISKSA